MQSGTDFFFDVDVVTPEYSMFVIIIIVRTTLYIAPFLTPSGCSLWFFNCYYITET